MEGDGIAIGAELAEKKISIHALRVEGDAHIETMNAKIAKISIHALRVEGDDDQFRRACA